MHLLSFQNVVACYPRLCSVTTCAVADIPSETLEEIHGHLYNGRHSLLYGRL